MDEIDINSFSEEKDCIFEGEKYSVRDNGAILRHPKENEQMTIFGLLERKIIKIRIYYLQEFVFTELWPQLFLENRQIQLML